MDFYYLAITYAIAITSPGPSLAVILKNSMNYSWKSGVFTSLGTVIGISCQAAIVLTFFDYIVQYETFYHMLGIVLGLYLFFLGYKVFISIISKERNLEFKHNTYRKSYSTFNAVQAGFFTDFFNPLALSFFFAIFSAYVDQSTNFFIKFLYWCEIVGIGFIWYVGVSLLVSIKSFQDVVFVKFKKPLNTCLCFILILLSIQILYKNLSALI
jgi:threonine/homoserine/homoserine lactone efflux protein